MPGMTRRRPQPSHAEMAQQHEQSLIDALRAWHRFEHGDEVGAMEDAQRGVEVPNELRDLFAAQAEADDDWHVLEEIAAEYGYDNDYFDDAAAAYLSSMGKVCECMNAMQQPEPGRGPGRQQQRPPAVGMVPGMPQGRPGPGPGRGPGPGAGRGPGPGPGRGQGQGQGQGPAPAAVKKARSAAQAMSMAGIAGGGLVGGGGGSGGNDNLPPAGTMVDITSIMGMPAKM